jgi:hypothetical protein
MGVSLKLMTLVAHKNTFSHAPHIFRRFLKRCQLKIVQATVDWFGESAALLALESWTSLAPDQYHQCVHNKRIQTRRKNLTSVQEKKHDSN